CRCRAQQRDESDDESFPHDKSSCRRGGTEVIGLGSATRTGPSVAPLIFGEVCRSSANTTGTTSSLPTGLPCLRAGSNAQFLTPSTALSPSAVASGGSTRSTTAVNTLPASSTRALM